MIVAAYDRYIEVHYTILFTLHVFKLFTIKIKKNTKLTRHTHIMGLVETSSQ